MDEFAASVAEAKEDEEREAAGVLERRRLKSCLDPMTRSLETFEDAPYLDAKIDLIYGK